MNATYSLDWFYSVLNEYAPIELSHKLIEKGDYDNSGILIKTHDYVRKVIFALDLSIETIKRAKRLGADTVVTHHPAIYTPVKSLIDDSLDNGAVTLAVKSNLNVISMHLNLDVADGGIDESLALGLGAKSYKIIDKLTEKHGYGREFKIENQTLSSFVKGIKKNFATDKVLSYGGRNTQITSCASFCGAGASTVLDALSKGIIDADVIVTSDTAHHHVKSILEAGKCLIVLSHYVAEEYGFKKYFEKITEAVRSKLKVEYFDDKRFR